MKKIITVVILLASTLLWAQTREMELEYRKAVKAVDFLEAVNRKTGLKAEQMLSTQANWVYRGSEAKYPLYLEAGKLYWMIGMSTGEDLKNFTKGPKIRGCVDLSMGSERSKKYQVCSNIGNEISLTFKVKKSGKYYYYVESHSRDKGLQESSFYQLYLHDSERQQRQECYNREWVQEWNVSYCK